MSEGELGVVVRMHGAVEVDTRELVPGVITMRAVGQRVGGRSTKTNLVHVLCRAGFGLDDVWKSWITADAAVRIVFRRYSRHSQLVFLRLEEFCIKRERSKMVDFTGDEDEDDMTENVKFIPVVEDVEPSLRVMIVKCERVHYSSYPMYSNLRFFF